MSTQESDQKGKEQEPTVRVIRPSQFDANTPQTPGMQRVAAVSRELANSQGIWAGVTVVHPHVSSGVHHHGELETVIYVVSGRSQIRWGEHMALSEDVGPGDFIYIPPFVPHQEINPSNESSQWVVIRTGQEPIVVNLEPDASTHQSENEATHPH